MIPTSSTRERRWTLSSRHTWSSPASGSPGAAAPAASASAPLRPRPSPRRPRRPRAPARPPRSPRLGGRPRGRHSVGGRLGLRDLRLGPRPLSRSSSGPYSRLALDGHLGTRVAALAHPGPLADAVAQVVELRAAHVTAGRDLDPLDLRRVQRERPLDTDAEGLLADGERLAGAVALTLDDDALEDLGATPRALDHLEVDLAGDRRRRTPATRRSCERSRLSMTVLMNEGDEHPVLGVGNNCSLDRASAKVRRKPRRDTSAREIMVAEPPPSLRAVLRPRPRRARGCARAAITDLRVMAGEQHLGHAPARYSAGRV